MKPLAAPAGIAAVLLALVACGTSTKTVRVVTTATVTDQFVATVTATPTRVVATHTVTTSVTYTPPPVSSVSDGTYVVGSDIKAGIYHTSGQSDSGGPCYWARLSSLNTSDIIDNGQVTGPTTTQVQPGDKAFELTGGCTWSKVS